MFALIYFSDPFYLVVPKHLLNSARTPPEYKPQLPPIYKPTQNP